MDQNKKTKWQFKKMEQHWKHNRISQTKNFSSSWLDVTDVSRGCFWLKHHCYKYKKNDFKLLTWLHQSLSSLHLRPTLPTMQFDRRLMLAPLLAEMAWALLSNCTISLRLIRLHWAPSGRSHRFTFYLVYFFPYALVLPKTRKHTLMWKVGRDSL